MKKALLISLIVALALIVIGGAGVAYAAIRGFERNAVVTVNRPEIIEKYVQPFVPNIKLRQFGDVYGPGGMMQKFGYGFGPGGMMQEFGYGFGPGGMMGGRRLGQGAGLMHDYMLSAFADAVGLTVEELDARLAKGETFKEIAIAQGTAEADLADLAKQVREAALDKAVAEGVITQAQADRMLERMDNLDDWKYGPWECPMWDDDEIQP